VPFAASMVLIVALWGACGGGVFPEATNSSSATTGPTKTPGQGAFLYVTEFATGLVSGYSRDPSSGALSGFGHVSAGNDKGPVGIGTSSDSSLYIYAVNSSTASQNVYEYGLNAASGALTALSGSPVSAGTQPQWIALTPDGQFAYVTNFGASAISQYTVDTSTGELSPNTPSSVTVPSSEPAGEVASNSFLYVSDQGNEDVISFPINSTSGTLGTGTVVSLGEAGAAPGPMIIDASNAYVYATDTALGLVYAFLITNSGFSLINGYQSASPAVDASVGVTSVITSKSVEFVYVANEASNSITQFQESSGVLTLIASYTKGLSSPTGAVAAYDSVSGNSYLYIANQGNGTIAIFAIDASTGALTLKSTVATSGSASQPMFPLITF
jgi:6-phosphogluconolactonase